MSTNFEICSLTDSDEEKESKICEEKRWLGITEVVTTSEPTYLHWPRSFVSVQLTRSMFVIYSPQHSHWFL